MPSQPPPPPPQRPMRRGPKAPLNPAQAAPPGPKQKLKRIIFTGAFAACTVVGAFYGAGLKTQQEFEAERRKIIEANPEERIKDLEHRRGILMSQKIPLDRKLDDLRARMKAKEEEERRNASSSP